MSDMVTKEMSVTVATKSTAGAPAGDLKSWMDRQRAMRKEYLKMFFDADGNQLIKSADSEINALHDEIKAKIEQVYAQRPGLREYVDQQMKERGLK